MSADYLEVLETDLTITALADREHVVGDDIVLSLLAWTSVIDGGVPTSVPAYGDALADGSHRNRVRAAALVVACVLGITSTGVAVAVGAHPFHPVVRLLKHILNPHSVHPLSGREAAPGGEVLRVRSAIGDTSGGSTSSALVSRSERQRRVSRSQLFIPQAGIRSTQSAAVPTWTAPLWLYETTTRRWHHQTWGPILMPLSTTAGIPTFWTPLSMTAATAIPTMTTPTATDTTATVPTDTTLTPEQTTPTSSTQTTAEPSTSETTPPPTDTPGP